MAYNRRDKGAFGKLSKSIGNMEASRLIVEQYKNWDKFCSENNGGWFWHTTDWLEYILNFKPERQAENFSFFVSENGKIKAIVPLVSEINEFEGNNVREFSYQQGPVPAPVFDSRLSDGKKELLKKLVFEEIDRLAQQHKISRARFWNSPLPPEFLETPPISNYLTQFGYKDISLKALLIDLKKNEKELWREMRRNHRRNILKERKFKIIFYKRENINAEIFNAYKETHHKAAGRKTRSDKTFEMMFDWLKRGLAFLTAVEFEEKNIGFEYYLVYKNNVYGASAANDPDFAHLAIRHSLEWEAILWMKQQGYSFYEIGLQQRGALPYDFPSKKQINISHFKKGFGGFEVPLFIGEKYYNEEYREKIAQWRKQQFEIYVEELGNN
jgi:hypothetical protein